MWDIDELCSVLEEVEIASSELGYLAQLRFANW